jgi:hypothetical protein
MEMLQLHNRRLLAQPNLKNCHQWRLLIERYTSGLLAPFICSCCGVIALDPIGWNGSGRPLCESCSDPEGRPKWRI